MSLTLTFSSYRQINLASVSWIEMAHSSESPFNHPSVFIYFKDGSRTEINSDDRDYEPLLFWMMFPIDEPVEGLLNVPSFYKESQPAMAVEVLAKFKRCLPQGGSPAVEPPALRTNSV